MITENLRPNLTIHALTTAGGLTDSSILWPDCLPVETLNMYSCKQD